MKSSGSVRVTSLRRKVATLASNRDTKTAGEADKVCVSIESCSGRKSGLMITDMAVFVYVVVKCSPAAPDGFGLTLFARRRSLLL